MDRFIGNTYLRCPKPTCLNQYSYFMKNLFPLLILLLLAWSPGQAQKVQDGETSFDYIRLPLIPIDASIENYEAEIVLAYREKTEAAKAQYEADLNAAQAKYDSEMATWNAQVKAIDDAYNAAMDEYAQKKGITKWAEQTFLDEGAPVKGTYPPQPTMDKVPEPYFPKYLDEESFAATYGTLDGYNMNSENAVKVTITMHGFEITDEKMDSKESKTTKDGVTTTIVNYWYSVSYKHPVSVKVESPTQGVIYDEIIPSTQAVYTNTTSSYQNVYQLNEYWDINRQSFIGNLDDQIASSNLSMANTELNSHCGISTIERNTSVFWVKDSKKFDYQDLYTAYEHAVVAYSLLEDDINREAAKTELQNGIDIWEEVLTFYDPDEKKSRLNDKVVSSIHYNLAEAYSWMDDYISSMKHMNKIGAISVKKYEKQAEDLEVFIDDQKARYNANN